MTGFLGPNGAGTATISGRNYVDLPNPGLEVGVLLDASPPTQIAVTGLTWLLISLLVGLRLVMRIEVK